ncbi:MAG TPA: efflux RND transporter periplasmic adaptor subunit [Candidatus Polarisedimenticolaceae bacterium]|nr:efflux RND transporter periplasmic adaptor subunit [Candidatus Polarisedimenticolaceae bacterium]
MKTSSLRSVVMLLSLVLGGCAGDGGRPPAEPRPRVAVDVERVAVESWRDGLELTAGVLPAVRATPGTVLMGRVDRVLVEEGDVVERGQTLARIESRDVAARLAQARAGVAAARAAEQNARRMHERMERLHANSAASDKNLEDAEAAHEAALAQLAAAEEAVKVAEVQVDYSEIVAPFAGVVVDKGIEAGDTAAPGMPLFVIDDLSKVKIEVQVPESAAASVAVGDPVEVEFRGERFDGRLSELVPAADPRSRTVTMRALLDNPERRLRAGMFARLVLPGGVRDALTVPSSAIVRKGPLTGVFVVGSDASDRPVAGLRWVTLGTERAGRVEVLTGLDAGERVVSAPDGRLEDGQPVEVGE